MELLLLPFSFNEKFSLNPRSHREAALLTSPFHKIDLNKNKKDQKKKELTDVHKLSSTKLSPITRHPIIMDHGISPVLLYSKPNSNHSFSVEPSSLLRVILFILFFYITLCYYSMSYESH